MTKHIFVTGGVVSSLGKGLTSASIGMILEKCGLSVRLQKLDPYINVDPAMMSPAQHGEVYVLDDGSEADLDLGHYERFTNSPLTKDSTWTTGRIYLNVIERERRGGYHGQTIQVIPHITNEIKSCITKLGGPDVDVVITEIGGTVGDIESQPFLEAIRQLAMDLGKQNCLYIHLTLVPYLKAAKELKTKPTQHSVGQLRQIGIQPDILICRTEVTIPQEERAKIGLFCNVAAEAVIEEKDKDFSIYEVPLSLLKSDIDRLIIDRLSLVKAGKPDMSQWQELVYRLQNPMQELTIGVIGRYAETRDAYKSVYESLDHAGITNKARIRIMGIPTGSLEPEENLARQMKGLDGILIPGGFGERGVEKKVAAVRYARENDIPFFGIGIGMQSAVIEYARNVLNLPEANSTEFDKDTPHPIFRLTDEKTMRRGSHLIKLLPGSRIFEAYGKDSCHERHRHRHEFNDAYRQQLETAGLHFTATSPDGALIEAVELPQHTWFVAVPYHPEYKSQPTNPHPLFAAFVAAVANRR